jgi:hypothetical protein
MPRQIRMTMIILGAVSIVAALGRRFAPRLREYSAASEAFWTNPKVINAREKAWAQARRQVGAQTAGGRA